MTVNIASSQMWHKRWCDEAQCFIPKSEKKKERDPKEGGGGPHTLITLSRRPKYTNSGADFWTDDVAQKSGKNDQKALREE